MMKAWRWSVLVLFCGLVCLAAEPVVAARALPDVLPDLPLDREGIERDNPAFRTSYAPELKPALETVVSVYTANVVRVYRRRGVDPREEFLRRYYGLPRRGGTVESEARWQAGGMGSGVVISEDGYILTNNHVISAPDGSEADAVLVSLNDGRELEAQLVGRDPESDLAVIKVEANDLAAVTIADSGQLEVGDIVFAIGNPMGVGQTITQGIVSATGRGDLSILGKSGYEAFIQTDASINPGNSGGALVDAYGRLVGINTAILSRSGGNIGIGFAIPSTFARAIALRLLEDGELRRGVLGLSAENLNADYVELFELDSDAGALIQAVEAGLPAALGGLEPGDVVVELNGEVVESATGLRLEVAIYAPGDVLHFRVIRDGEPLELEVVLTDPRDPYGRGELSGVWLEGVEVSVLDADLAQRYGVEAGLAGLVVTAVAADSPYVGGLVEGAVILEINGRVPQTLDEGIALVRGREVSRVYIYFKGQRRYLSLRVD